MRILSWCPVFRFQNIIFWKHSCTADPVPKSGGHAFCAPRKQGVRGGCAGFGNVAFSLKLCRNTNKEMQQNTMYGGNNEAKRRPCHPPFACSSGRRFMRPEGGVAPINSYAPRVAVARATWNRIPGSKKWGQQISEHFENFPVPKSGVSDLALHFPCILEPFGGIVVPPGAHFWVPHQDEPMRPRTFQERDCFCNFPSDVIRI